jgi:hypothetical protein
MYLGITKSVIVGKAAIDKLELKVDGKLPALACKIYVPGVEN